MFLLHYYIIMNLKKAERIIDSYTVNVKEFPEFLEPSGKLTGKTCKRNMAVAKCKLAIEELRQLIS